MFITFLHLGVSAYIIVYISEVCPPGLRPLHMSAVVAFAGIGMLAVCLMSVYYSWQILSAVLCAITVANFFVMFAVPETSMWLRAKGRLEEADKVDEWFDVKSVTGPIAKAVNGVSNDDIHRRPDADVDDHDAAEPPKSYWSLYLSRTVWKPTLITVAFFVCQQCSGVYVLLFYSIDVLRDCRVPWDGSTVSAIMSAARLVGGLCFAALHRVNRRTLLVVSGVFMAVSLIVIVAYMKTFEHVQDPPFSVVLVIAFTVYMFFAILGILPLAWSLCGEVFPMAVKGTYVECIRYFSEGCTSFSESHKPVNGFGPNFLFKIKKTFFKHSLALCLFKYSANSHLFLILFSYVKSYF